MTHRLETDLRTALAERAARVPADATARVSAIEYRPRTRGLAPPVALGALAAGAAGTAALAVSLVGGAANAFAGWTPAPTPPSRGQIATALRQCSVQSPIGGLPLRLTDTRGPFTFEVYADARSSAVCITGPSFTSVSGSSSSAPVDVPADQVLLSAQHSTTRAGQAYSFADGHAGAGVTGVKLILDDGTDVQATVAGGWFVAWWPGARAVKTADLATTSGERTQTFDFAHRSPCGPGVCGGGTGGVERSVSAGGGTGGGERGMSAGGGTLTGVR